MSIQTFTEPCHMPCPDMAAYSLNKEQKAKGLEMLKKVKAQVREGMLSNLRKEYEQTKSPSQRSRINQRANRIKRNWS